MKNKTTNTSKAQLKIQKEIEKRNNLFKKATKAEKRVLIAKDVIAQIKAKRYIPSSGTFVDANFKSSIYDEYIGENHYCLADILHDGVEDIKSFSLSPDDTKKAIDFVEKPLREAYLDGTVESCSVCALGGMFMSCTLYNNKTKLNAVAQGGEAYDLGAALSYNDSISNGLDKFFSQLQLELIEEAFEHGNGYFGVGDYTNDSYDYDSTDDVVRNYYTYADKYPEADDRMIAIMKNIVKNNGTFVPEKFKSA